MTAATIRPANLPPNFPADTDEARSADQQSLQDLQRDRALFELRRELHAEKARVQTGYLHASPAGGWIDAMILRDGRTLEHWQTFTRYNTLQVLRVRERLPRLPGEYRPALRQRGMARPYDHRLSQEGQDLRVSDNHPGFVALHPFREDGTVDWNADYCNAAERASLDNLTRSGSAAPWTLRLPLPWLIAAALLLLALLQRH